MQFITNETALMPRHSGLLILRQVPVMPIKTNTLMLLLAVSLPGFTRIMHGPIALAEENSTALSDRLAHRPLPQISLDIALPGGMGVDGKPYPLPVDHAAREFELPLQHEYRAYATTQVRPLGDWNFCYQPLLFEEPNAERYGEVCVGLQPAVSAAKFYARTLTLPLVTVTRHARKPACFWHPDRPGYGGVHEQTH